MGTGDCSARIGGWWATLTRSLLYRGRFAPSPTGPLHLGGAITALICAAMARRADGRLLLRIEDLDPPRVLPGCAEDIAADLGWLGVGFDEGPDPGGPAPPYLQSQRASVYAAAIDRLATRGLTYLCDCSRAEIARVASAPHAGEEGPRYPGTCRSEGMRERAFRRAPAVRLAVPGGALGVYQDVRHGRVEEDVDAVVGDFVLRRGDGVFAYQLAVVVDDLAMGVTEIIRGADLAPSAPRQALLASLLDRRLPPVLHVPLLVAEDGARLAKRSGGVPVRDHRDAGTHPGVLAAALARAYGQALDPSSDPVAGLASSFDAARLPSGPVPIGTVLEALA